MPIPKTAQPFADWEQSLVNALEHPINAIEGAFGFGPKPAPPPDPNKDPSVIEAQRKALQSFQDAQAAKDANQAPRRRLPNALQR